MNKNILFQILLLLPFSIFAQVVHKPRGCFAGTNGTNPLVLSHAEVRGVLLIEKWANIEPLPGIFDFTDLDNMINTVKSAGLKYSLAIAGGTFGSPNWLIDSLGASYHSFQYMSQNWRLPLWWDPICDQRLSYLIAQLGIHYARDRMLSHIYVTQMTVNGIEGHLNGVDMPTFTANGFTNQKWITAAKTTATTFANAFPDKPIVFEIHEIDHDTIVPAAIINDLTNDSGFCGRIGLGMWWLSGKQSYQPNLIDYIAKFQGDKYAQVIGRSDDLSRFKDDLYSTVFTQAKDLGIRYIEPWPYEFQNHTYDSLFHDFNQWANANFSSSDTCTALHVIESKDVSNSEVVIYPNPTNGQLKFQINFSYQKLEISLFNLKGQEILSITNKSELDLSTLNVGTYIIKFKIDKNLIVKKLIKLE